MSRHSGLVPQVQARKKTDIQRLVHNILKNSSGELYSELRETNAAIYVDPKGEKTTFSIRAIIANHIEHLRYLKNTPTPFSIRDWVLSDRDSWVFFPYTPAQREALKPLVTTWFSIAVHAIKERNPTQAKQKIWLIIDELHSLQKIEHLAEVVTELRKYGGAIALATQNVAQLETIIWEPWISEHPRPVRNQGQFPPK